MPPTSNLSSPLGTPARLTLFGGLLLAGVVAPGLAIALGTAAGGGAAGVALAGGIQSTLPVLFGVGMGWLVNKQAAEDGPSPHQGPRCTVPALLNDTEAIGQAIGEAIRILTEHVRVNPSFTPDEGTGKALEAFGAQAVGNMRWFFQEFPPRELEHLHSASLPQLLGASGVPEILDAESAASLIEQLEARTNGRLPEPARTELIRLCVTRFSEALVGVFAHHLAEGDHSFAGFQLKAQAETLEIVQGLQRAAQTEFPRLHDIIQTAASEIKQTVKADGEDTRALMVKHFADLTSRFDDLQRGKVFAAEASAILQKVICEAEDNLKHHQPAKAAQLLAAFSPNITDSIESLTRAHFYGVLGEAKLESDDLEGALSTLKKSLAITYTSQAAVQYHTAHVRLTHGSALALEQLREAVGHTPDDPGLASLFAGTLTADELQQFVRKVPVSVAASPVFAVNTALAYSQHDEHDLAIEALKAPLLSPNSELLNTWITHFQLTKFLAQVEAKNAARLLPNEEADLETVRKLVDVVN